MIVYDFSFHHNPLSNYVVWEYHRFNHSYRDIKARLMYRGIFSVFLLGATEPNNTVSLRIKHVFFSP